MSTQMSPTKTTTTKSRAGHYSVTVRSTKYRSVYARVGQLSTLDKARWHVPELQAQVAQEVARIDAMRAAQACPAAPAAGERSTTYVPAVGARVRSYDFAFRDDCYMEGTVESVQDERVHIAVDAIYVEGEAKSVPAGKRIAAPVNGLEGFMGPTNGVTPA